MLRSVAVMNTSCEAEIEAHEGFESLRDLKQRLNPGTATEMVTIQRQRARAWRERERELDG
jgi:hypothetical protein